LSKENGGGGLEKSVIKIAYATHEEEGEFFRWKSRGA